MATNMMTLRNMKMKMIMTTTMMTMPVTMLIMMKRMLMVISPGNLAHPVPPLTKHKILLQGRKLVDVQHLIKKKVNYETFREGFKNHSHGI